MLQPTSTLHGLYDSITRTRRRSRRSTTARPPRIELLEERVVLSTYYVATTGSDSNAGTQTTAVNIFKTARNRLKIRVFALSYGCKPSPFGNLLPGEVVQNHGKTGENAISRGAGGR